MNSLTLALASAALLAAEPPALPPNHPPLQGSSPPAAPAPAAPAPAAPLPEGHPPTTGRPPPNAEELLRQLDSTEGLREREKSFEIASSLGKLYYSNGRPSDALAYFQQAEQRLRSTRELYLVQRAKLGRRPVPSAQEAGCSFTPELEPEARGAVAAERARAGDAAAAAACARAALEPLLEVQSLRGNALYLGGDVEGALQAYAQVLEVEPRFAEALFARAAVLYESRGEDVRALKEAHQGFEAFAAAWPDAPRTPLARKLGRAAREAVQVGGMKALRAARAEDRRLRVAALQLAPPAAASGPMAGGPMAGGSTAGGGPMQAGPAAPPALSDETIQAMQNVERTPELEAQLTQQVEAGEEALARGRYEQALGAYRQVMPLRPDGRVRAGLAWTLVKLGKPTAERVWGVAVGSDAAALERLGDVLKAKGDAKGAKALWARLLESAPDYAGRASVETKLRE